ncbi:uncharacterized protein N7496_006062 [Penicillium cataractarum]|uniref:PNPLA domain-containing protein n=1 Tax=Penicillium cataractarum TaxID=2100454 RepID=A0A9W9V859_9EURO|nr:uncharacterized protein N7496_006062 [Penicillium cataractarum]KAJ5369970.1 hypothetical protein N7496_006062 [Penicillium cataractarum]
MASWLDLISEAQGWTLVDTGRLEKLVEGMSHPHSQYPSLILFAGNASRIKALQALFPRNNITRRGPAGFTRLHLSTETAESEQPLLFAEGSLLRHSGLGGSSLCRWPTEKLRRYPIFHGRTSSLRDIKEHVISKLLLPWTQVLCFFVNVAADVQKVYQVLDIPRGKIKFGSQLVPNSLRVIMVLTRKDERESDDTTLDHSIKRLKEDLKLQIITVDLRGRHLLSPTAAFEPLRREVLSQIQITQREKTDQGFAFSAQHLCTLWNRTIKQINTSLENLTIDCLKIARENHQLNLVSRNHIEVFLNEAANSGCEVDDIYVFIASAFLLNAYPPSMHHIVFKELYEQELLEAWSKQAMSMSRSACRSVLAHLNTLFNEMSPTKPSAIVRKRVATGFFQRYGGLYSTNSCFICLCRAPEHMMACRHTICDICVVIFGMPSRSAEYHYDLKHCPLCNNDVKITIQLLPPTKGPLILSLDGGGIRGIIQLGLLRSLERRLGGGITIPHIFDLCAGTSVGGLNIMDFIFNKSSAGQSFHKFPELARKIFGSPGTSQELSALSIAKCALWIKYFTGFLADGWYDGNELDNVLQEELGLSRRIFDFGTTPSTGSRVAVITSRISDGKACVLANYRGMGLRDIESAYEFLIPETQAHNPFLWEAFFKAKKLPGFGSFQDGGVRANNPLAIALKESAIIWPNAGKHDLIVSIGTGSTADGVVSETNCKSAIRDSAVPRLIRAFMASPSMDGEQGFFEALNFVPDHMRADIHRLDHVLPAHLPRLDDVSKLTELSKLSFSVSDNLMDQIPLLKQGSFICQGSILCKGPRPRSVIRQLIEELPGARFQVAQGIDLGPIDEDHGCYECGYYRKKVSITVNSLEERFIIEIASSGAGQRIGGFPKSAKELLHDQQVDSHFGRPDHAIIAWPRQRACFCLRGTRRVVQFADPPSIIKKRRRCI